MATTAVPAPRYARPSWRSVAWEWITTVDHKKIGIMYLAVAIGFFLFGGLEALVIRMQLAMPENRLISPAVYNQLFTMHGTVMVFLAIMPLNAGLGNYIVPLMVGANDMAFPRLNALSLWLFTFGGLLLLSSFVLGGAPDAGWFAYAPVSGSQPYASVSHGMDFWVMGILLTGVASTLGAVNFIVTIFNLRAPGMKFNRMPLFCWAQLVTSFLLVFALPSITVGVVLLFFDRNFGTGFFMPAEGGDPLLWQHLFWFFGHPEVYIMILPIFGIISEVLPVFSRKPIFGYAFIAYSSVAIGFLGFTVWAHHMFAVGMGPLANAAFSATSMLIAVPTGVKIFNWIGTLWGGSLNFKAPLYYAVGFVFMFIVGGITGVMLGSPPIDLQLTDTYFVIAHFHYVLVSAALLGLFAAFYYWWPKMFGHMLNERLGIWQFWVMFIGFNITFFPMHYLGLIGMPRRTWTYARGLGWDVWNQLASAGSLIIAVGVLIFLYNVLYSMRRGERATDDPWDGHTLEWATSSPPPAHNFDRLPVIRSRRPVWDLKYGEAGDERSAPRDVKAAGNTDEHDQGHDIHLPPPSFWPITLAFGLTMAAYGLIFAGDVFFLGITGIVLGISIVFTSIAGLAAQAAKD